MVLRQSLLLGVASVALAGTASAQQRGQSRDDLLDALTRHIQICSEITETQARLSCFDRLQTQIGGVQAPAPTTPTPLQASPAPTPTPTPIMPSSPSTGGTMGGSSISAAPLAPQPLAPQQLTPQPLAVPGGGTATLGGAGPTTGQPSGTRAYDPDAAFDPRSSSYRPPDNIAPKPQPQVQRTGPRPVRSFSTPQPLVTLGANNLTYGPTRYWEVTVTLTSNTQRPIETQAVCTFMNGGRSLEDAYFGPITIQPGEQITTELVGPPTTAYVDSTNCRIMRP